MSTGGVDPPADIHDAFRTCNGGLTVTRYILKRILLLIPIMLCVSFIIYFIIDLTPGDVVDVITDATVSEEDKAQLREDLGLNDPFFVRYFRYIGGFLRGDLGVSAVTNKNVFKTYMEKLPTTAFLAASGTIVALLIAIPLGITAAVHQNTWRDSGSTVLGLLGLSMPNFWLGLLLIIAFSLKIKLFPSLYNGTLQGMVLPAITLGTGQAAIMMRTTRSSMLETIRQDYLRTIRAKGVPEKVVINKHALKNALIPIVTVAGTNIGHALGGAVITESVFSMNGVGRLITDSVKYRDTEMVCGAIILTTLLSSVVMLIVDIIYAFIDPTIKARYSR